MRRLGPLVAFLWLVVACDCGADAPRAADDDEQGTESPPAPPEPSAEPSGAPEAVRFETADGVTIAGTLRRGESASAPAVILAHRLGADRGEWDPLVAKLAEPPGLTILAIDLRGHGASTTGPSGEMLDPRSFDQPAFEAMAADVIGAVEYLHEQHGPSPRALAVVGSSIGSSAAIRAAAEDARIGAVVAVSPGRAYRGVDAITPVPRLSERPLLAIAAAEEPPAAEAARNIAQIAPRGQLQLYPGSAHGMAIAAEAPEMLDLVDGFVREALGAAR